MTAAPLTERVAAGLAAPVAQPVRDFAATLAAQSGALAVLFYGSNLRTGLLEGVLDYYVLLPGAPESGIWPRVSYHEWPHDGVTLRAKVATMTLARFAQACSGALLDTTIWARFTQPAALIWQRDEDARDAVVAAVGDAAQTAARLAAVLGPERGRAEEYWAALFRATYRAEFRIEKPGRENAILSVNRAHFDGLLPLALDAGGVSFDEHGATLAPRIGKAERDRVQRWWARRQRWGKALNLARLAKASTTFEGAARYAAWKIERHTGVAVTLTPWRERHPVLAAPAVLWQVWKARRNARPQP